MGDVVVTVPMSFGLLNWIDEGDAAGEPWSGEEWDFYLWGNRPAIKPGERVYVVYNGAVRGYAPLIRVDTPETSYYVRRRGAGAFSLVRGGGAEAVTIPEYVQGFRGWRYRWWDRAVEVPFPGWQNPHARIGFTRPERPTKTTHAHAPVASPLPDTSATTTRVTRVVHVNRDRDFDIYIGRPMPRRPDLIPTGWGNPFRPPQAIERYRAWIQTQPQLLARLPELRGKTLGCWCAPKGGLLGNLDGHICHGEVLAALADAVVPVEASA